MTDIRWNQLPEYPQREQEQSEDCMRLTLTCPTSVLDRHTSEPLPVVAFIHGGALMIGSGDRHYYDPTAFCTTALTNSRPIIFASINYHLGALGFLHCPEAASLMPPNNGLYDQILAFEWIQIYITGFAGNPDNLTAIGQSAGAASLSLHSSRFRRKPLYRKAIRFSGSTTVLVTMTPEEHQKEFLFQAGRLGVEVRGRSMEDVAREVIDAPIDAIRSLEYCGAPCSPSELIAEADWATMRHARSTLKDPETLLAIYNISEDDEDDVALEKICRVVTDIGYYGAVISSLLGVAASLKTYNYHVLFDIGNPFSTLLQKGRFATHTWDVVSLFGAYDDQLPQDVRQGIFEWRRAILAYCNTGEIPCDVWRPMFRSALVFRKGGTERLRQEHLTNTEPERALEFAEQEGGEYGPDLLWEDVIRFFLKTGNPRYSHEVAEIMREYGRDPST
ncbi:MAG: hypothetical protein Q9178_001436 [Gyalolechia marmorata]